MGPEWELLQTAKTLRSVFRWPRYTVLLWGWPPGFFQTISGFKCASERRWDKNQTSHRPLGSWLLIHRGTFLRCRDNFKFIFMQYLDADVRQRDGRILIDPLTAAALEIVSRPRSSTELHSFVAETVTTSSFSGSSWTQMSIREMAGQESILSPPPWDLSP